MFNFKIHHIGYATPCISKTLALFQLIGFETISEKISDYIQNVNLLLIKKDTYIIELIEPLGHNKKSPIDNILKRNKLSPCPYHFCLSVPELNEAIVDLNKYGLKLISPTLSSPLFNGNKVAFLWNSDIGLLELLEELNDKSI